ncbi:hypothetical protein I8H83_04315 [Candidatus Saccharibacteria bacterium]|nr:hypothetical protein [Candidatus Saccharibacteria bacterium]
MSELFSTNNHLDTISMAHDIILHNGDRVSDPETGNDFIRSLSWDGLDIEGNLWSATLTTSGLYSSNYYALDLRSMTTSDSHRLQYNCIQDKYTYEYPAGEIVANTTEESVTRNMHGWLALCPSPDAIVYDAEGKELERQREFEKIGAQTAIEEALSTSEGRATFIDLTMAVYPNQADPLYERFYNLTRRPEASFSVGRTAIRAALELRVGESIPRR